MFPYKLWRKNFPYKVLCLALLASCVSAPTDGGLPVVVGQYNPEVFEADGRIALRFTECRPEKCEEKSYSAELTWQRNGSQSRMTMIDPFGKEQLQIEYAAGEVIVREADKAPVYTSQNEMANEIGLALPLELLPVWLTTPREKTEFEEAGWRVRLRNWQGSHYASMRVEQAPYFLRLVVENIEFAKD